MQAPPGRPRESPRARLRWYNAGLPYTPNAEPYRWLTLPRWYLWEGGFALTAKAQGPVPVHAHHAIQIVIALDGSVAIRGADGPWRETRGLVVRPDAEHSFDCNGALGVMLFVDPESAEGAWLAASLRQDVTLLTEHRVEAAAGDLRGLADQASDVADIGGLVRRSVSALRTGIVPGRRMDARVTRVLEAIRRSDDLRFPLDKAAEMAHLSATRFAHLFKEQVGLPFSRYMLWRKLTRAMVAVASEGTIAAAAHAADFADAAHLTRTFYQMVGMAPSVLMRGEFVEIPSPFGAAASEPSPRRFPRAAE